MNRSLNRPMSARHLALFALLGVAAWLAIFGDKTPHEDSAVVEPAAPRGTAAPAAAAPRAPAVAQGRAGGSTARSAPGAEGTALEVAALIARDELIPVARDAAASRDLFPPLSWTPPPPKPAKPPKPPPPRAPELPFVYLGKKLEAGQWEVYLGRGEQLLIVREGMTLNGIYQVSRLQPPTLTLLYLPLQQSQTLSIGGSP